MPNWCAQSLTFTGTAEAVGTARATLATFPSTPFDNDDVPGTSIAWQTRLVDPKDNPFSSLFGIVGPAYPGERKPLHDFRILTDGSSDTEVKAMFMAKWTPVYDAQRIAAIAVETGCTVNYLFAERGRGFKGQVVCSPEGEIILGGDERLPITADENSIGFEDDEDDSDELKSTTWYDLIAFSG